MRSISAVVLAACLTCSSAFATDMSAPLASGKPAGVKEAQMHNSTFFIIAGVALAATGIALAASGDSNTLTPAATTTTTATRTSTTTTTTTTG